MIKGHLDERNVVVGLLCICSLVGINTDSAHDTMDTDYIVASFTNIIAIYHFYRVVTHDHRCPYNNINYPPPPPPLIS